MNISHPSVDLQEKRSDVANRDTPLIRNQWYVACLAAEVTRTPLRRTILEQDIVLYRKQDGEAVALQNRCAHRSYPLHLGGLNEDRIVCGYHGFEYDPEGRCQLIPALGVSRPAIRVQRYPTREIGPFIWIWTGDADASNTDRLVEQPWFEGSAWRYRSGYYYMKANYLGMKENVRDLSHLPFVHSFARGQTHLLKERCEVDVLPDRVCTRMSMENFPVGRTENDIMQFEGPVTEYSHGTSRTPAMEYAKVTHTDSSAPPKIATRYIVHCTTPETSTTTHYYWAISRDFGLTSTELDKEIDAIASTAFREDIDTLEEIERLIERDNRPDFREKIVSTDAGGIQAMRLLARMAAED